MEKQLTWKEKLADKIPAELGREIDIFEQQMELRKQGKIDEKVFAETRLRRGIYGQRYDNGQRHDGKRVQKLKLSADVIKGPETLVGRAGHDAHQDSLRRRDAGAVGNLGRSFRGIRRRRDPRDDAPGFSVSLRPYRRHAGADAPARRRRHHDAGSLRQRRAQRHRLPAGGYLPRRNFRHDALCQGLRQVSHGPSRHPGLRPQGEDRLFRLRAESLRPGDHARHGRHRQDPGGRRQETARLRLLRRRRFGLGAVQSEIVRRVFARRRVAADHAGDLARLRPPGREAQPGAGAHQIFDRAPGHRGVSQDWSLEERQKLAARSALDRLSRRRRTVDRAAAQSRR